MRSDEDIRRDVETELRWNPAIDAADIAVAVKDGEIALTGFVKSYAQKWEAEEAAKSIAGVTGLANDVEVRLPETDKRPDPDIARDAAAAIRAQLPVTADHIRAALQNGRATLEGEVEWQYQRTLAEMAVTRIKGVNGVYNTIQVKPSAVAPNDVKREIEEALKRKAELEARSIIVGANGSEVVLKGTVHSWGERKEAERAAWQAPGVTKVHNWITVKLLEPY